MAGTGAAAVSSLLTWSRRPPQLPHAHLRGTAASTADMTDELENHVHSRALEPSGREDHGRLVTELMAGLMTGLRAGLRAEHGPAAWQARPSG
ncbi:hypothetical protein [Streptomyces decoyicus]